MQALYCFKTYTCLNVSGGSSINKNITLCLPITYQPPKVILDGVDHDDTKN